MYEIGEVEQIITPDGQVFSLNNGLDRAITEIGGRGMPGVEYMTQQGYMQPYQVVTGWTLEPRTVTLLLTFSSNSRADYWQNRAALMNAFRFNRGGPLVLRHIRADGTRRDLYCYPEATPVFADDFQWPTDTEEIGLIAYDPLFKEPDFQSVSNTIVVADTPELVFPATFPIEFVPQVGSTALIDITYLGTFATYPQIEIVGPYSSIKLTNQDTGAQIGLAVPVGAGQSRFIDLTPMRQAVVDGAGVDRFNELMLPESNLVTFNLRPAGRAWENSPFEGVLNGRNRIRVEVTDATNFTTVTIVYKRQFIGVEQ